jgi:hypothetical protein
MARRIPLAKTTDRGYGTEHQGERKRWEPVVASGQAYCAETICVMPDRWIPPGSTWHLAHTEDRTGYRGPAHARCNLAERNRRHNRRRRTRRWRTSRQW